MVFHFIMAEMWATGKGLIERVKAFGVYFMQNQLSKIRYVIISCCWRLLFLNPGSDISPNARELATSVFWYIWPFNLHDEVFVRNMFLYVQPVFSTCDLWIGYRSWHMSLGFLSHDLSQSVWDRCKGERRSSFFFSAVIQLCWATCTVFMLLQVDPHHHTRSSGWASGCVAGSQHHFQQTGSSPRGDGCSQCLPHI